MGYATAHVSSCSMYATTVVYSSVALQLAHMWVRQSRFRVLPLMLTRMHFLSSGLVASFRCATLVPLQVAPTVFLYLPQTHFFNLLTPLYLLSTSAPPTRASRTCTGACCLCSYNQQVSGPNIPMCGRIPPASLLLPWPVVRRGISRWCPDAHPILGSVG